MSLVNLIKPKNNITTTFTNLKDNKNEEPMNDNNKLTFDKLLKFIEINKKEILNPSLNYKDEILLTKEMPLENDENLLHVTKHNDIMKPLDFNDAININNMPENLSNIFKNYSGIMLRFGIKYDNNNFFICQSIIVSILVCLKNVPILLLDEINAYISIIVNLIINQIKINNKIDKHHKNQLEKEKDNKLFEFLHNMKELTDMTLLPKLVKYIAELLHINIFILDCSTDKLCFVNTSFNPYRINIFLLQINEQYYEPIFFNEKKFLHYNCELFKQLINNPEMVYMMNSTSPFEICNFESVYDSKIIDQILKRHNIVKTYQDNILERKFGINKVIKVKEIKEVKEVKEIKEEREEIKNNETISEIENNFMSEDIKHDTEQNKVLINTDNKPIKYDKKILNKKTAKEIRDIAQQMNISIKNINNKNKTKLELINEIILC